MTADAKARIRAYLKKTVRNFDLDDAVDIFESGIVNSLYAVELVVFTEQEFGIIVEDDDLDLDNFRSIDVLAQFVERKMSAESTGA